MVSLSDAGSSRTPYRFLILSGGLILALFLICQFLFPGRQTASPGLPYLKTVPPFTLTERSGRMIQNSDLAGKIWVADFIFTTCPGPCPLITAGMVKLQTALKQDSRVQLVTFTVDPEDDTPPVLSAYAQRFGADPEHWWFLTGPEKQLYDLIENGFMLGLSDNRGETLQEGQYLFTHSTRLALVDAHGTIRGYYDGLAEESRNQLLQAIETLKQEN